MIITNESTLETTMTLYIQESNFKSTPIIEEELSLLPQEKIIKIMDPQDVELEVLVIDLVDLNKLKAIPELIQPL